MLKLSAYEEIGETFPTLVKHSTRQPSYDFKCGNLLACHLHKRGWLC